MSVHYPTDDCEDCGTSIEYGTPDGTIQPDAEVSCPNCGAVHIVNVGEVIWEPDAWLTLVKHGGEVIAELRAANHERYVAGVMTGEAMRNGLMAKIAELRAELATLKGTSPPATTDLAIDKRLRELEEGLNVVSRGTWTARPPVMRAIESGLAAFREGIRSEIELAALDAAAGADGEVSIVIDAIRNWTPRGA